MDLTLPTAPFDIPLPGDVTVTVRPCDTALYEAAKAWAGRQLRRLDDAAALAEDLFGSADGLPDLTDEDQRVGFSQLLFTVALARKAITAWQGVTIDGEPAPLADRTVAQLMRHHRVAEEFLVRYTAGQRAVATEGNA